MARTTTYVILLFITILVLLPAPAAAFGAGNIASLSKIEGHNWRHGDIEDLLASVMFLHGKKWSKRRIKQVYFGNWLRDYSQAVDVGTLKGVQAETIRVLVWVMSFMNFGYATGEFEVTAERLGVYRPEEHIDNPKDYADNEDARKFDPRLRGPVNPQELAIDSQTGMKNYMANERGGWATSAGYVKFSFQRSIHYGRMYTSSNEKGKEEHLDEALRCLGQGLHCLEDFGAHTNYVELALRELGYHDVFPHVGTATEIHLGGKRVFPLVTGTFGGVDFLHSVIGEANDHVTQTQIEQQTDTKKLTEIEQMDSTLSGASSSSTGSRSGGNSDVQVLEQLLKGIPGLDAGSFCSEARRLQEQSDAQARMNSQYGSRGYDDSYGGGYETSRASGYPSSTAPSFAAPPGSHGGPPGPDIPGTSMDPAQIIPRIYPILEFRDRLVRRISDAINKVPGLEKLIDSITERITLLVFGLLAPFIQPLIKAASKSLKDGSSTVVDASAKQQYIVWNDPHSSDPTHSILSKDHFSNILNPPAGAVAAVILKFVAERIVFAWENPNVPLNEVLADVLQVFHHPAIRNHKLHNDMFEAVRSWSEAWNKTESKKNPTKPKKLNEVLSSRSVKGGHNHTDGANPHVSANHSYGNPSHSSSGGSHEPTGSHGGGQDRLSTFASDLQAALPIKLPTQFTKMPHFNSSAREVDPNDGYGSRPASSQYSEPSGYGYSNVPPPAQPYDNSHNQSHSAGYSQQPPPGYSHPVPGAYDANYHHPPPPQGQVQYGEGYSNHQNTQPHYGHAQAMSDVNQYANAYHTNPQAGWSDGHQHRPHQPPPPHGAYGGSNDGTDYNRRY